MDTTTCRSCGKTYPTTSDYFRAASRHKGTLQSVCRTCVYERKRATEEAARAEGIPHGDKRTALANVLRKHGLSWEGKRHG